MLNRLQKLKNLKKNTTKAIKTILIGISLTLATPFVSEQKLLAQVPDNNPITIDQKTKIKNIPSGVTQGNGNLVLPNSKVTLPNYPNSNITPYKFKNTSIEELKKFNDSLNPARTATKDFETLRNEIVNKQNSLTIKLKKDFIELNNSIKGNLKIRLPLTPNHNIQKNIDGAVVNTGANTSYDITTQPIDGGVQNIITLKDSTAPQSYTFQVSDDPTDKVELTENGGAKVTSKDNKLKAIILPPWAKDANGKNLPTNYIPQGNQLIQVITTTGAVFPVSADPTWCGRQIHSVGWQNWRNPISLAVIPTYCGRFLATDTWDAWTEVYNNTPWNNNYWPDRRYGSDQYWSMFNQFKCHYANTVAQIIEGEWNLEPSRRHVSILETYIQKCNP
jgi:Protein of unknown function (DUF2599)